MRAAITATACATVAAVILGLIQRVFTADKSASIQDALNFMQECEDAFVSSESEGDK